MRLRVRGASAASLLLLVLGCTKTEHVTAEPPPADPESAYPPPSPLPPLLAPLGRACGAPVPEYSVAQCGLGGKVAVVSTNRGSWPAGLRAIVPGRPAKDPPRFEEFPVNHVGFERGRVWVASSCAICRTEVEETRVVDIALATDDQLVDLQVRLGMPKSPILRSTRAFADNLPRQKS